MPARDPYADVQKAYADEVSRGDRSDSRRVRTGLTGSNRTPVPRPGRDWTVTGRCAECKGPTVSLQRVTPGGVDYAEQTEHRRGCSRLQGEK